ncbi:secretory protein [Mucilaginibacter pallidiroseus]|uniref:Secretory protein n=1 Tax=Mucilaginibacter pallidiroseus TaxID=2599295 RepID=A0A563UE47_9SPHI|nr:basic secretory protein-like protein [Mucilaginibacter pallidiroseus]TWR29645.1 secretory protein [Mucilaginibacter pallidiroseus]
MKKQFRYVAAATALLFTTSLASHAQEVIKKGGYTLIYESNYAGFDPALKNRMIKTFFEVYPKLAKEYNPQTIKEVKFLVDTAYKGVAATANGQVRYSPVYMMAHPGDIDVVTHEVMHIIQSYGRSVGPGWLTEGIADYVRYTAGIDNAGAKWTLPDLKPEHNYKNSYRITARFFIWIENKIKAGTIKTIDKSLRDHTYTPEIWQQLTGKNLDELWAAYTQNPSLT